ncbi:MAG TPA: hypothetical protein VMS45_00635 [Gemmatimonadaceae bacterium]|nr:hypothetical protein [Gemmatimonadaceae bacterium]
MREADELRDRHPVRREHQHFIAGREQPLEREEERVRAAVRHDDVVGFGGEPVLAAQLLDQRLAQLQRAARVRIVRLARACRGGERLDDVRRRVEIRLAALQMHDLLAGGLAGAGGGHHLAEFRGHAQHGAIGDQLGHGVVLMGWA